MTTSLVQNQNHGWRAFSDPHMLQPDTPKDHERIWVWRKNWVSPRLVAVCDIDPVMNETGLLWKPEHARTSEPGAWILPDMPEQRS